MSSLPSPVARSSSTTEAPAPSVTSLLLSLESVGLCGFGSLEDPSAAAAGEPVATEAADEVELPALARRPDRHSLCPLLPPVPASTGGIGGGGRRRGPGRGAPGRAGWLGTTPSPSTAGTPGASSSTPTG